MIGLVNAILNIHRFKKHEWKTKVPRKWQNLGTWRYVTTFKHCYPNIADILTKQYGLAFEDKIIVYIMKEVCLPSFNRYRTRFKKVFYGTLEEYQAYLKDFMGKKGKKKGSG